MTIEEKASKFIEKHKKTQAEKQRLEMKLELKREELSKIRDRIKALGFKDVKALREAIEYKEKEITDIIGDD